MIPARLRTQTVVIEHWGDTGGTDVYGNPVRSKTGEEELQGYVEQTEATEVQVDRDTFVSNWLLVLDGSPVISGGDRVRYEGVPYEVIGKPNQLWVPRLGRVHHTEARLRLCAG